MLRGSKRYSNLGSNSSRIQQNLMAEFYSPAEFSKIPWSNRILQNFAEFYSLVKYGKVRQKQQITVDYGKLWSCSSLGSNPGRTQQDLVDLVEYSRSGRLLQITANYSLMLSLYLLSRWKQVDIYKVSQVYFIISY